MNDPMTPEEIRGVLDRHEKWLNGLSDGAGANLTGANLARANLTGANLADANLTGANLTGANLADANLADANLTGAYLAGANLTGANLADANLADANLTGAYLTGAYLARANLARARLPHHSICPEVGAFDCYKKVNTGVICLRIPATAGRVSSLVGRKCRAEFAYVMEGSGRSGRGGEYIEGKTYVPDRFDPDPRVECSHGVHFFMTRAEAEAW